LHQGRDAAAYLGRVAYLASEGGKFRVAIGCLLLVQPFLSCFLDVPFYAAAFDGCVC
jgi:hypothetical protein